MSSSKYCLSIATSILSTQLISSWESIQIACQSLNVARLNQIQITPLPLCYSNSLMSTLDVTDGQALLSALAVFIRPILQTYIPTNGKRNFTTWGIFC